MLGKINITYQIFFKNNETPPSLLVYKKAMLCILEPYSPHQIYIILVFFLLYLPGSFESQSILENKYFWKCFNENPWKKTVEEFITIIQCKRIPSLTSKENKFGLVGTSLTTLWRKRRGKKGEGSIYQGRMFLAV